ncbi:MAG TPA: hypothetical protein VMS73_10455 [Anaerolineaceae bacterium]|nr:hypothetical protein [Anaerolineaceae bacterium]
MRSTLFRLFFLLIGISLIVFITSPATSQGVKAAPSACSWIAGPSSIDYDWNDGNNWDCGVVPGSTTDVIIVALAKEYAPTVTGSRAAGSVLLTGNLGIGVHAQLAVTNGWSNLGEAWIDSQGVLAGAGVVNQSGVTHFLSSGAIQGALTIDAKATASVEKLYVYGNVSNNGLLSSENADTQFHMLGQLFTNNGTVETKTFYFEKGGTQEVAGGGTWNGTITSISIAGPTHLTADSDTNFSPFSFFINNDGSVFDIGNHQVTFNGPGQLGVSGSLIGATNGTVHTLGADLEIHIPNGGLFTPPLYVDGGVTHALGTFSGPITVALGGTLLVMAPPAGSITALQDVTINGTLGGEDPTSGYFEMKGLVMTVNGQVTVADLRLDGPWEQVIIGGGLLNLHSMEVEAPAGLLLSVPLQLDQTLSLSTNVYAPNITITLATSAAISGNNSDKDIFSTIKRNGPFLKDTTYSFGNLNLTITFANSSVTLPTSVTMKVSQAPWAGLRGSIRRSYTIQTAGGGNWSATLRLDYRDTEFLGNADYLQAWARPSAGNPWVRQAITTSDANQDWIELAGLTHFSDWGLVVNTVCMPLIRR